ncbi:hypothetical protein BDM02DRAFT_1273971 [Thelephora ganbajun]|uniref:Uncharacterized protein n=1 Tax=Thelephora ganbajun TaxID=370292 RepID=A0ACB6Z3S3_THEGA|nr:hypothetical protein BDM02DRAFT_1273971 [Thelephora ganbajun]
MEHCNIFPQSTSIGLLAGPTAESQTTSEPLGRLSISPTQRSESVGPGGVTPDDSMEYRGIFKSSSPFPREREAPKVQSLPRQDSFDGGELQPRDPFAEGAVSNVQEIEEGERGNHCTSQTVTH